MEVHEVVSNLAEQDVGINAVSAARVIVSDGAVGFIETPVAEGILA